MSANQKHTNYFKFQLLEEHKMKKYIALALATLMAVLCLASCGSTTEDTTDAAAASDAAVVETVAE